MMTIGSLWLLRPWWLLALPALALLYWWRAGKDGGIAQWLRIMDPGMRIALERLGYFVPSKGMGSGGLIIASMAVLVLALSGPARQNEEVQSFRNLDLLVVIIDMSDSVTRGGAFPEVKAVAKRILDLANGRPVALILHAGESYVASAPTENGEKLQSIIAVLNADTMPDKGSRTDRALIDARGMLEKSSVETADIIVIADGGGVNAEALHEAELLSRNLHARVSAIFVTPGVLPYGAPTPNQQAIEKLAEAGGGVFGTIADAEALIQTINAGAVLKPRDASVSAIVFSDYGRFLLLAALPFVALLFRRRSMP